MDKVQFPKGFVWGVSTAAPQVEGGEFSDGKGLSNWDVYPTIDKVVYQNQSPNDGCDHYFHLEEDIKKLAELGVKSYRFSFAWTRILPNGIGEINEKGFEFYDRLLNELEKYHIEPFATIFHWDYPYELVRKGGWLNPDSPKWFLEYASILLNRYKNRIKYWIPINEPPCVMEMGGTTLEARYSMKEKLQCIHNMLLSHGYAARCIKENGCKVGTAFNPAFFIPFDENSKEDIEVARRATFELIKGDYWRVTIWSDPIVLGKYPDNYYEIYNEFERPHITEEEMKIISTPLDFFGFNLYFGTLIKADGNGGYQLLDHPLGNPKTCMDWDYSPKALYWGSKFLYERYKLPLYITENGCAVTDIVSDDKKVHDGPRIEYLKQYLKCLKKACNEGIDVRGYSLWSFMDNYEWRYGYSKRFGLIYVDYQTKERIKKDSYYFYQDTIKNNGQNI